MKAIILAAGQGSRLRPLTDDKPKCMLELGGASLLEHDLRALQAVGVSDVAVIGGHCAGALPKTGIRLIINPRFATTNMVTTLFCARDVITKGDDIIIAYGDCVYTPEVIAKVAQCDAPIGLAVDMQWRKYWALRMPDPLSDAETLKIDDQMRLVELGKKPKSYDEIQGQYMGLFKLRGDHAEAFVRVYETMDQNATYDGRNFDNMYMTSFIQHLINIGWSVQAVPVNNGWLEVDTPEDLALYQRLYEKEELSGLCALC